MDGDSRRLSGEWMDGSRRNEKERLGLEKKKKKKKGVHLLGN